MSAWRPLAARGLVVLAAAVLTVNVALFGIRFAGEGARRAAPLYHEAYHEAFRYLAAHRPPGESVLVAADIDPQAYIHAMLAGLIRPIDYQRGSKDVVETTSFHLVRRVGNIFFFRDPREVESIRHELRGNVWAVVHPGQVRIGRVEATFTYPTGAAAGLEIRRLELNGSP